MAVILPQSCRIRRRPITVYVEVLVVESRRGIVPLCDLDGTSLVTYVNQVQTIRTAIRVVVIGNGVQLRISQLMIY